MEIEGRRILILGGSGLVGLAVARRLLSRGPRTIVIAALREDEARDGVDALAADAGEVELIPEWGDVFLRAEHAAEGRGSILGDAKRTAELLDDIFGALDAEQAERSHLVRLFERHRPDVVIDCINTATAIAYQNLFESTLEVRRASDAGELTPALFNQHLATLYLPQLIRHVQLLVAGLGRGGVSTYIKIGTSGTGGMGLNVPFTHSEERPSRTLLAKASVAGAHSMLLFLLARTPGAPAIVEIKPTAAIAWKSIGFGEIRRGGRPLARTDAVRAVPPREAFSAEAEREGDLWRDTGESLRSVYLDAGENGLFALSEFETISSLGLMEIVTPEEIAVAVTDEIEGRPTGRDVISALDGSVFGPTYRGGMLREAALSRMEELETEHEVRSVAFEMLGPPRLTKLLFEASILERLFGEVDAAAELDPESAARDAAALIEKDERLRTDILAAGVPILRPDGLLLRGSVVNIGPEGEGVDVDRLAEQGWLDLRASSWEEWRQRCRRMRDLREEDPGVDVGSRSDVDLRARSPHLRPGALVAMVLRREEGGERIKR